MRLHFREYGSGDRPLLILHGLFGSADNWHTIARRLGERFRVVTADLRNHGKSPHSDVFTFPAMAGDVAELIDELGGGPVDLAGHSLGGKVAMELALSRPELVRRLVSLDMAPKEYPPHHTELRDALLSLDLERIGSRKEAERQLSLRVHDRAVVLFLLKSLVHRGDGGFAWQLNLRGIADSFSETGKPIEGGRSFGGPALFLVGALSDYVDPAADLSLIRSLFPQAVIRRVEAAGHWLHAEQPEQIIAALAGFLA